MPQALILMQFILQYGVPAARSIYEITTQTAPPTKEQWDAVFALAQKSYDDYIKGPSQPTCATVTVSPT